MTTFFSDTKSNFDAITEKQDGVYVLDQDKLYTVTNGNEKEIGTVENINFDNVDILNVFNGIKKSEGVSEEKLIDILTSTFGQNTNLPGANYAKVNPNNGDLVSIYGSTQSSFNVNNVKTDAATKKVGVNSAVSGCEHIADLGKWIVFTTTGYYVCDDTADISIASRWKFTSLTGVGGTNYNFACQYIPELKTLFKALATGKMYSTKNLVDWELLSLPDITPYVTKFVWYPVLNRLFGICGDGTLYYSEDEGITWIKVTDESVANLRYIQYDPKRNRMVGIRQIDNGTATLVESQDGIIWTAYGNTFGTPAAYGYAIEFCPDYNYMIWTANGNLLTSTDGGLTYKIVPLQIARQKISGSTDNLHFLLYDPCYKRYLIWGIVKITVSASSNNIDFCLCSPGSLL